MSLSNFRVDMKASKCEQCIMGESLIISIKLEQVLAVYGENLKGRNINQGPGWKAELRYFHREKLMREMSQKTDGRAERPIRGQ